MGQYYDSLSRKNARLTRIVEQSDVQAYYRPLVDPQISGVVTPSIVIDGESGAGTDYVPHYLILTINPGDDVLGATRLMNEQPEVIIVLPGQTVSIPCDTAITDVYAIGITVGAGGAAVDIDTFTDYQNLIGRGDTDLADWIAEMVHFTFDASDEVLELIVTLTEAVDTNVKLAKFQGVSHAE